MPVCFLAVGIFKYNFVILFSEPTKQKTMKTKLIVLTGISLVFIFSTIQAQPGHKVQKERIYMPLKDSICEFYPETAGDVCRHKRFFEYNEFGKIVSESSLYLNYTNIWSISKTEYQFDYEGNVIEAITQYLADQIGWIPYQKQTFTYDFNNQILESVLYENLSEQGTNWGFFKKYLYKYNLYKDKTGEEVFVWNQEWNEWENLTYEQYYYNSENQMYLYRHNIWDENNEEYIFNYQTRYVFNEWSLISGYTQEMWEPDEAIWLNLSRANYNYLGDTLKTVVTERWHRDSLFWINNRKYAYTYDTNMNVLIDSTYFWSDYFQSWQYYKKECNYYSLHVVDIV